MKYKKNDEVYIERIHSLLGSSKYRRVDADGLFILYAAQPLKKIKNPIKDVSNKWKLVPSDEQDVPEYIDSQYVIYEEADEDESWEYDEYDWQCFSFCLPTCGPMHSNDGVLARKSGCLKYIETLERIINDFVDSDDWL